MAPCSQMPVFFVIHRLQYLHIFINHPKACNASQDKYSLNLILLPNAYHQYQIHIPFILNKCGGLPLSISMKKRTQGQLQYVMGTHITILFSFFFLHCNLPATACLPLIVRKRQVYHHHVRLCALTNPLITSRKFRAGTA